MSAEVYVPKLVIFDQKRAEMAHRSFADVVFGTAAVGVQIGNLGVLHYSQEYHSENLGLDLTVAFLPIILISCSVAAFTFNSFREIWYESKIDQLKKSIRHGYHPYRPILQRTMR